MQYLDTNTFFSDEISKNENLNREFAAAIDSKDYFKAHELLKQGANCTKSHIIDFVKTSTKYNSESLELINEMVSSLSNQGVYDASLGFHLISLVIKNEFIKPLGTFILDTLNSTINFLRINDIAESVQNIAFSISPIHRILNIAIKHKYDYIAYKIIESGIKLSSMNLAYAIVYKKEDIALKILESGTKPSSEILDHALILEMDAVVEKILKSDITFSSRNLGHALFYKKEDIALKILESGVKPTQSNFESAAISKMYDIALKMLDAGVRPSYKSLDIFYKNQNLELIKLCIEKEPNLISFFENKTINYLDKLAYKYLSDFNYKNPMNISYKIAEDAGFFSPSINKKNELIVMLYGDDYNGALRFDRELPAKFVKQGYDVIVSSIGRYNTFHEITKFLELTNSQVSGIFLFAHGNENNNQHYISHNTLEFLSNLRESLSANAFHSKGVDLAIESCHSGALDFLKLKHSFPEIDRLFITDISNKVSYSVDHSNCEKFDQSSEIRPVESYVSCTSDFDKTNRNKSYVDLNSENVKEFIERNANKQLSQYEKTCFHRIHSEAPFKYSDELVNECKNYFETLEA